MTDPAPPALKDNHVYVFTSTREHDKVLLPDRSNEALLKDAMLVSFYIPRPVPQRSSNKPKTGWVIDFDAAGRMLQQRFTFGMENDGLEIVDDGFLTPDKSAFKGRRIYAYTELPGGEVPRFSDDMVKDLRRIHRRVWELLMRPQAWADVMPDDAPINERSDILYDMVKHEAGLRRIEHVNAQLQAHAWFPEMLRKLNISWGAGAGTHGTETGEMSGKVWEDECAHFVDSFKELSLVRGAGLHYLPFDEVFHYRRE